MKRQIITLLIFVFGLCVSSSIMVYAQEESSVITEVTTASTKSSQQSTKSDKAAKKHGIIRKKTNLKVNNKLKLKKVLHISNKSLRKYDYSINHSKVAKVSKKGVISGLKAGSTTITVASKETNEVFAKVTVNVENKYTDSELRLLSSLIYCEARGESYAGQKAVGIVTTNRVASSLFPGSLSRVVYQPGQYTPARSGALASALQKYDRGSLQRSCIRAAQEALNGSKTVTLSNGDINMSGYLFFSRYVSGCRLQIGAHQFK